MRENGRGRKDIFLNERYFTMEEGKREGGVDVKGGAKKPPFNESKMYLASKKEESSSTTFCTA